MRIWSIAPSYLDGKGLVALWRESLLMQKVLQGLTKGYTNHPQLKRFKNTTDPVGAIADYLRSVADEADKRGYHFDRSKIVKKSFGDTIPVTRGQVEYEFRHLLNKLEKRSPDVYRRVKGEKKIRLHPEFTQISGDVEDWEVIR